MAINAQEYLVKLGVEADWKDLDKVIKFFKSGKFQAAAMGVALTAAGKVIYNFVKSTTEAEFALVNLAKQQHKTVEATRASQNALTAMGKTMQEVSKDPALKKIYTDIVNVNKAMALPDMKGVLGNVNELRGAFMGLKSTLQYAMQWVNFHILKDLEEPIKRITDFLRKFRDGLQKNMSLWTAKIASYISAFARGLIEIANLGVKIAQWIHDLPDGVKQIGVALMFVIGLLKTGPIGMIFTLVTAIGGLMEDYDNWKKNKKDDLQPGDKDYKKIAFPGIWELISDDSKDTGDKVSGVIELLTGKLSEGLKTADFSSVSESISENPFLSSIGVTIVGSIFGMSTKAKIISILVGTFLELSQNDEFKSNCKKVADVLYEAINSACIILSDVINELLINLIPKDVRDYLGIETTAERRERNGVAGVDENGDFITTAQMKAQGMNDDEIAAARDRGKDDPRVKAFNALSDSGADFRTNDDGTISFDNINDGSEDTQYQYNRAVTDAILAGDTEKAAAIAGRMKEHQDLGVDRGFGDFMSMRDARMDADQGDLAQFIADLLAQKPEPESPEPADDGNNSYSPPSENGGNPDDSTPPELDTSGLETSASTIEGAADTISSAADSNASAVDTMSSASSSFSTDVTNFGSAVDRMPAGNGKPATPLERAQGGRIASKTLTEVAEDGDPEYIIPVKKQSRAIPLVRQMLSEMGGSAVRRIVSDLGIGGKDTIGGDLGSIGSVGGGGITINNYNTVNAPCTIVVNASGADAHQIGSTVYSASERHLIRTVKGVLA